MDSAETYARLYPYAMSLVVYLVGMASCLLMMYKSLSDDELLRFEMWMLGAAALLWPLSTPYFLYKLVSNKSAKN